MSDNPGHSATFAGERPVQVEAQPAPAPLLVPCLTLASPDGGLTWLDLGGRDLGRIRNLALGIDGRYLYAATDHGLWRLAVDRVPAGQAPAQVPTR
jgi:hypothetical protein